MSDPHPHEGLVGTILVVDDEEIVLRAVERVLTGAGHDVETAPHVAGALEALARRPFDLVLTDLRFPGGPSGLDLLVEVRSRHPGTRLILMTAGGDLSAAAAAVERGIDQLILKPFDAADLRARIDASLARRREEMRVAHEREMMEARLRQRDTESKIWILRAAHALAAAVEAKDPYTAGHARRVTAYAMTIAEVTGRIDVLSFRLAGDLHDVGKIGIPDDVLSKPEELTKREFEMVRKHPVIGARILGPLIDDPLVLEVVKYHHERWDGSGYPEGLRGEEIPFAARVLAVADSLDAMTSARAWRDELPWDEAVAVVLEGAGSLFDPEVVRAFEQALPLLREHFRQFRDQGVVRFLEV